MTAEERDILSPEQLVRINASLSPLSRALQGLSAAVRQASSSLSCLRTSGTVPGQDNQDVLSSEDGQDTMSVFDGVRWTGQRPCRYVPQGHP